MNKGKYVTSHVKDISGQVFGEWKIISFNEEETRKHKNNAYWNCLCSCGKLKPISGSALKSGRTLSCGHSKNRQNIGKKFGKLLVKDVFAKNISGRNREFYLCECDCGRIKEIRSDGVNSGSVISCNECSMNKFILSENETYYVGTCSNGTEFFFDLDDYEIISQFTWCTNNDGYIVSNTKFGYMFLHRLLTNFPINKDVDHINGQVSDNRKQNLRVCSRGDNTRNKNIFPRNLSIGINGVRYSEKDNKWHARLTYKKKQVLDKSFDNVRDAIAERIHAEKKYYKDFAYSSRQDVINKNN